MLTIYSEDHALRCPRTELSGGEFVTPYDRPSRATTIVDRVRSVRLGEVRPPDEHGRERLLRVHDPRFVEFLETVWERWSAGDSPVRQSIAGFAEIADTGRQALLDGDTTTFCDAVDANFDLRRMIFTLDDEQAALVTAARAAGVMI